MRINNLRLDQLGGIRRTNLIGPANVQRSLNNVYAGYDEPMRYAGVTMCGIFLLGLLVLPFAPETKGKPLPE